MRRNPLFTRTLSILMLILFMGTVVSKDLYHILLPHTAGTHNSELILCDAGSRLSSNEGQRDCFICKFEFSSSQNQDSYSVPELIFQYHELSNKQDHPGFISTSVLSTSLRGPPEVI